MISTSMIKLKLLITVFVLFNFKNHVAIIVQSNISAAVKPIPPPTIIRIGGLFSRLNQVGQVYELGQYTLAAFLLAIEEINNSTTILKSIKLEYAVEDCYLSSSAAITETVNLITQVFGSKGVKAFIGPDVSTEAIASASVAASFQTVQVSSSATSSALSNSLSYPYFTRTCPSDVYQAKAMASLVCQYGWRNIVTFASSDYYGTAGMASFLSEFASQCSPNRVLVSVTVDINAPVIDAPSVVSLIKLQARIFVLFMSANSASSILNEGFNSGLFFQGCQIIGSDAMMGPEVYQSIQPSNIPIFLKGMLGFIPTVSYTSPIAQQFLQNMRALPNTIFPNNECSTATDGNGQSLYLEPTSLYNNNSFTCTGLNISSILPDGSNLTPFAAYAYDAVYLLAYGLDYVTNHSQSLSTGQNLYNALINKISFEGATGFVNLVSTANNDTMLGPGDRETGIAYSLLNFQPSAYASSTSGSSGFVTVGGWTIQNGTFLCSDSTTQSTSSCHIVYNTASGNPPSDSPAPITQSLPSSGRLLAMALFLYIMSVLAICMLYAIWTPHFLNSFFNEKMALIFIGILVGATRILLSVFEATDQTCSGIIWTEHISFWAAFGGLVLKSSKVRQIRSTLNGEDATISNHPYTRDDSRRFLSERWGLVDAPDLKRDQSAIEPSVPVTARSDIPSNESDPLLKSIDNQSIGSHQTTGSAGFRRRVSDSGVVPIDIRDDGIVNLTKNQQVSYASETEFSSTQGELANHTSLCKQVSSTSKLSQNTSIEYTSLEYTSQTSVTGSRIESMSPSANQRTSLQEQLKICQIYDTQNANDIYDSSRSDAIDSVGFGRNNREIAELYGLHRVPDWVKTLIQQDTDNYLLQRLFVPGLSLLIICMILIQVVGHPYATTVYTYSGAQGYAIEICSFEHIQVHELVLIIEFLFIIIGVRYCFFARYREGALETEVKYLFRAVLVFAFLWLVVIAVTWDFPAEFNTISANQYAQLTFVISVLFTVTLIFTLITVIFIVFQRYWVLSRLPVHNAMAENLPPRLVMEAIVRYPETITKRDLDGLTAYDWAMSTAKTTTVLSYSYFAIVRTIVEESLPFDPTHPLLPDRDPKIHRYFWSSLVQSDSNCGVVEYILESFPDKQVISKLIHSTDRSGRKAIDLASPMCKMIIQESTYFLKLYEIESLDHAHYESCTSIVLFANNRQLESKPVVLKFMKYKEQLESEIDARFLGKFDPYYVVPVLNACRASVDEFFYQELCKWNLGEFLYYVELERGSRSLKAIISKEALTESRIRRMIKEVVSAVAHIHSRGYSHNDIRPSNFIRRYDTKQLSLIDLKFASQLARDANNNNILSKFRSYFFSSSESSSPPSSTTATPAPTKSVAQASDSPYTWSSGYLSPEVAEKNLNFDFQRFFGKLELGLGRNPWSMQTATKDTNNAESFLRSSRKKRRSSSLLSISSVFTDRNKTQVKSPMNFYDVKMGSRRLLPTDRHYNEAPLLVEIRFHHRKSLHKHEEEEAKTALLQEDSANKIESISSDVDICNQESTTDSAEFLSQIRVPVGCTALDVWSIGAVLYELIVDAPLFLCSKDDNILHRSDMELLVEWSDNTKVHKLSVVADPLARDLLSKLLTKDPLKRPALSEVLEHEYFKQLDPRSLKFHPNNLLANISEPVYDFYISHRDTDPDTLIVDKIYSTLTEAGYSVSLGLRDDPELVSRLNSDSDRCSIIFKKMLQSKTIVLIFSRTGMRNNYYDKFNLELLESSSACDMLLFEHKAAVELQVMINSKNIIPVFIGPVHLSSVVDHSIETDSLIATTTNDSFISKYLFHNSSDLNDSCYPILRDIVIQSVEQQYYRCVDDFGYDAGDSDTSKNLSINQILTRSGGQPNRIFLEGDMTSAIQLLLHDIKKM